MDRKDAAQADYLPQRRIGIGWRSLTGSVAVKGWMIAHESSLERDFLLLARADPTVLRVVEQPVRIPYLDDHGRRRTYVPDFLVDFRDGARIFYEAKYRAELTAERARLRARIRAAVAHARSRGMRFKILTETEIRTPLLRNVRFLDRFRTPDPPVDDATEEHLVATLEVLGPSTPANLLEAAYAFKDNRLAAMPAMWRLVAEGRIGTRLLLPLTMASEIWANEGKGTEWPGPHSYALPLAHARWRRNGFPEPPPDRRWASLPPAEAPEERPASVAAHAKEDTHG